jgi:hypothetical protein
VTSGEGQTQEWLWSAIGGTIPIPIEDRPTLPNPPIHAESASALSSYTLADVLGEHHLTASRVARVSGLPLERVQRMIRGRAVASWEKCAVVGAIFQLTGRRLSLEELAILVFEEERQ